MADHMHPKASAPQPSEAVPDRAKRTVSVRCLAGSSFELEVDSAETGREVAERIAAAVGRPAGLLVLTSSGCVIDQCQLLLHQVQHDEIWYVVRRLGAGLVAMLWEHLLEKKAVSDVAALNETMSLTFGFHFNQSLDGIQLPSSLQSLTFGNQFNRSLDGIHLPSNLQSFDVWLLLRPELGWHPITQQPAEFDVWLLLRPEVGGHPATPAACRV